MWLVLVALKRPYTFVVMSLLIVIVGALSIIRMPTDIFPNVDIPVISVVWNYGGLTPEEMERRVTSNFERFLTTVVNDIDQLMAIPSERRKKLRYVLLSHDNDGVARFGVDLITSRPSWLEPGRSRPEGWSTPTNSPGIATATRSGPGSVGCSRSATPRTAWRSRPVGAR